MVVKFAPFDKFTRKNSWRLAFVDVLKDDELNMGIGDEILMKIDERMVKGNNVAPMFLILLLPLPNRISYHINKQYL